MADSASSNILAGKLFSVEGLVVVITGGGSGLGAYMARTLALNGAAKVFIIGRREHSLRKIAESIPDKSIIFPVVGDVGSKTSLKAAHDIISKQVGHVDVLIANSGFNGPSTPTSSSSNVGGGSGSSGDKPPPLLPIDQLCTNVLAPATEDESQIFLVNVIGVQYTVATFLPLLDAANKKRPSPPKAETFQARPQIITVGSVAGFNRQPLANLLYGPSKAAVMHLTKQLATLLVPYDIRVNGIAPGLYFSEMTESLYNRTGTTDKHNVEGTFPRHVVPATRTGDEEDMAGAVLFLCSRAGAYINGNILVTDGGRLGVVPASY